MHVRHPRQHVAALSGPWARDAGRATTQGVQQGRWRSKVSWGCHDKGPRAGGSTPRKVVSLEVWRPKSRIKVMTGPRSLPRP